MASQLPDLLNQHALSRRNRRTALRAAATGIAALLGGSRLNSARAAPPPPPVLTAGGGGEIWPACSEDRQHYCVSRFEIDGEDQLTKPAWEARTLVVGRSRSEGTTQDIVYWDLADYYGKTDYLQGKQVILSIRSGRLKLGCGIAFAGPTLPEFTGSAEDGWATTISTKVGLHQHVAVVDDVPLPEQAGEAQWVCQGAFGDVLQNPAMPAGQFASADATSYPPHWSDGGWNADIDAPHFAVPGTTPDGLTHSHYTTWMSLDTLSGMGLTLTDALAGKLVATRIEAGQVQPVEAELSEWAGGMLLHIPDVTFSSPTIRIAPAKTGSTDHKKKKKKRKKKKHKKKHKKRH